MQAIKLAGRFGGAFGIPQALDRIRHPLRPAIVDERCHGSSAGHAEAGASCQLCPDHANRRIHPAIPAQNLVGETLFSYPPLAILRNLVRKDCGPEGSNAMVLIDGSANGNGQRSNRRSFKEAGVRAVDPVQAWWTARPSGPTAIGFMTRGKSM